MNQKINMHKKICHEQFVKYPKKLMMFTNSKYNIWLHDPYFMELFGDALKFAL
jgi:hypothetical protein